MKVYLSTLGCKLNESELEDWARRFKADGHEIVANPESADVCVLNTCTVTHVAAHKSRQMARQIARSNPKSRIILTGCYVDISPDEARSLTNVALVVPNPEKDRLVELAGELMADARFQMTETGCRLPEAVSGELQSEVVAQMPSTEGEQLPGTGRTRAFVKIQDGCNMGCTYCIIPLARGRERSRELGKVVNEVQSLVSAGYKEIILTGVQISSYRDRSSTKPHDLRDLVSAILAETDVPRLRLTSMAPWELDESLLDLWRDVRLCRHLHLSLQSGSDTVLRRMRRPYTTAQFAQAVELARSAIPELGITTDVIVGFPGESDVELEQSLRFVEQMQFSRVHVFPYSAREGTYAATLPLPVSDATKKVRLKQMQEVAAASAHRFATQFVGHRVDVLWESPERTDHGSTAVTTYPAPLWSGYTGNYLRVQVASPTNLHNQISSVYVTRAGTDGVVAQVL